MKITFPFIFLMIAMLGCKNDHIWNEESNTVHREVKDMLHNYYKGINEKGILEELEYLDKSADFKWHPPGFNAPISRDSAEAIIRNNALVVSSVRVSWDSLTIIPISRDTARYVGKITNTITDSSGYIYSLSLSEEGVAVKRKDGWKLLTGKTDIVTIR